MKRKRYSVEQIVAIVKQAEVGVPVAELIRQIPAIGIAAGRATALRSAVASQSLHRSSLCL